MEIIKFWEMGRISKYDNYKWTGTIEEDCTEFTHGVYSPTEAVVGFK